MDDKRILEAIYNTWQAIYSDVLEVTGPRPSIEDKVQFIMDHIDTYGKDKKVCEYLWSLDWDKAEKLVSSIVEKKRI